MKTLKLPELICELKKLVIEFTAGCGAKNISGSSFSYCGPSFRIGNVGIKNPVVSAPLARNKR